MNDSIKRICLDIHDSSSRETVNVKRGDTGRAIHIALADGGMPYRISEECYAVFNGKKPDDTVVLNPCTIENNVIIYQLTAQTVAAEGLVRCEVTLYGSDGKVITSPRFNLLVDAKVYNENDKISSSDEFNVLEDLLEDVQDALEGADSAINIAVQASAAAAGYVIEEASGEAITLTEAENMPLAGLRICGKTTQDGVPTPDAPVALVSPGDSGTLSTNICGKNLCDIYAFSASGLLSPAADPTLSNNSGTSISTSKPSRSITVTQDGIHNADDIKSYQNGYFIIGFNNDLKYGDIVTVSFDVEVTKNPGSNNKLFLMPNGVVYSDDYGDATIENGRVEKTIKWATYSGTPNRRYLEVRNCGKSLVISNIQIELGSTVTEYEPSKAQNLAVSTPNGLPGIRVSSGGNYTDENGQQWICDEIDFWRGVHVQRVYRKKFTNTDGIKRVESGFGYRFAYAAPQVIRSDTTNGVFSLCNRLPLVRRGETFSVPYSYTVNDTEIMIALTGSETIADLAAYLAEKPIEVQCVLVDPIETPLSEEDMAAYKALRTYKNYCVVSTDGGAYMELAYLMNAKKYLARLAENGGLAVGSTVRVAEVTLSAAKWTGTESPYSQVVRITGVTSYSQVDLKPSVEQMAIFHEKDLAFVTENDEGVVTVYAIGQKPTNDYTMQVSITEVSV